MTLPAARGAIAPMKSSLPALLAVALCGHAHAEPFHFPTLAGGWQPLAARELETLPESPAGAQIVQPAPDEHFLFFVKAAPAPAKATAGAGPSAQPAPAAAPFTRVYRSTDPNDFGTASTYGDALHLVARFPVTDPRIVQRDGKWFLAGRAPDSGEMRVAQIQWKLLAQVATASSRKPGIAIRAALYDDSGSAGKGIPNVSEQLARCKDIEVTKLDADGIRAGLDGYDVVIFTGGSGGKQANTIGLLGREQVRRFVEAGGGYIGICAGAYLACDGFSWGVKVLDAKTPSPKWERGGADLEIETTADGQKLLGLPRNAVVRYHNGPVLVPAHNPAIPDFEPLVFFRTETAKNGSPAGAQINTPAMARGAYGRGRVLACSPHPEQTAGMENWIEHAVRAVAP